MKKYRFLKRLAMIILSSSLALTDIIPAMAVTEGQTIVSDIEGGLSEGEQFEEELSEDELPGEQPDDELTEGLLGDENSDEELSEEELSEEDLSEEPTDEENIEDELAEGELTEELSEDELSEDELSEDELPEEELSEDEITEDELALLEVFEADDTEIGIEEVSAEESGIIQAGSYDYFGTVEEAIAELDEIPILHSGANAPDTVAMWKELLLDALTNKKTELDVSKNNIPKEIVKSLVAEVINANPELYYVDGTYKYSYNANDCVVKFYFTYRKDSVNKPTFEEAVNRALAVTSPSMSDYEKALAIHDYLVLHCEYYENYLAGKLPSSVYTAEGCLVNAKAVCSGYAAAYKVLMDRLGISCVTLSSNKMNHAWNMVNIDGQFFHVDATWDDPVWDHKGYVGHAYFLKSDDKMVNTKGVIDHFGWGQNYHATSNRFNDALWNKSTTGYFYLGDKWAYLYSDSGTSLVLGNDVLNPNSGTIISIPDCKWNVWGEPGYWVGYFYGLAYLNGNLYYSDKETVYRVDKNTGNHETIANLDTSSAYCYRLWVHDGKLWAVMQQNAGDEEFAETQEIKDLAPAQLSRAYFDKDKLIVSYGEIGILTLKTEPENPAGTSKDDFIWSSSDDSIATVIDGEVTPVNAGVCTITAQNKQNPGIYATCEITVKAIEYTVKYLLKNGKILQTQTVGRGRAAVVPDAPEEKGFIFEGWEKSADFVTANMTIKPIYTAIPYNITYIANNGLKPENISGLTDISTLTSTYTVTQAVSLKNIACAHHVFLGWYDGPDDDAKKVTQIVKGSTGDRTFYAHWREYTYNLKLSANGGKGTMAPQNGINYFDEVEVPASEFTRLGYYFDSWNTKANGSGITYVTADDTKQRTDDVRRALKNMSEKDKSTVTLYAQWEPIMFSIEYVLDSNNSSATDGFIPVNASTNPTEYGINKAVKLANPTREGYVFDGWYEVNPYSDDFNPKTNKKVTTIKVDTKVSLDPNASDCKNNHTLYAKWTKNVYNLSFNANGGKINVKGAKLPPKTTYNYTDEITLPTISDCDSLRRGEFVGDFELYKAGYICTGFCKDKKGTGEIYSLGATVSKLASKNKENVTLYAIWKPIDFKITYKLGENRDYIEGIPGPVNSVKNPVTYNITKTVKLSNPTRQGFTFDGWYAKDPYETDFNPKTDKKVTSIKVDTKASLNPDEPGCPNNHTLYAKWIKNSYSVSFNANGGKITVTGAKLPAKTKYAYNNEITLPDNMDYDHMDGEYVGDFGLYRDGYVCRGFCKNKNGTGDIYGLGSTVSMLAGDTKNNESITLYAIWKKVGITSAKINENMLELNKGAESKLTANIVAESIDYEVTWDSRNEKSVKVEKNGNNAKIYALNPGVSVVTMTVTAGNGKKYTDTAVVTVCGNYSPEVPTTNYFTPQLYGAIPNDGKDDRDAFDAAICSMAMLGPNKGKTLYVPEGVYDIELRGTDDPTDQATGICINGNEKNNRKCNINIVLDEKAVIQAIPNNKENYDLIWIYQTDNVSISGGTLIGDRSDHTGKSGEWGHCIGIYESSNISISGMDISNGWGDGIYVGDYGNDVFEDNTNISINNCNVHNNRRNNLSITNGKYVMVYNSSFIGASGTDPQYGVDIETNNSKNPVEHVFFYGCTIKDNKKGALGIITPAKDVNLIKCDISGAIYNLACPSFNVID